MEDNKAEQHDAPSKSKEEIQAERKAKKAEKAAKKTNVSKNPETKKVQSKTVKGDDMTTEIVPEKSKKDATEKVKSVTKPDSPTFIPITKVDGITKKEEGTKSNAELKAERRAKQEAQRAAKLESKPTTKSKHTVDDQIQADRPSVEKRLVKTLASQQVPQLPPAQRKVQLFSHLQQQERRLGLLTKDLSINQGNIHPAIIRLGLQYASRVVCGSNARALALMNAMKIVISDYSSPADKELLRDLQDSLKPNITFLKQCRPISVTIGNAIRYLKRQIRTAPPHLDEATTKRYLCDAIDKYVLENVELAGRAICEEAAKKISSDDVILTYGYSSLLLRILLKAYVDDGKKFRVVVLDCSPRYEGLQFLRRLAAAHIPAVYMLISGASYIMPQVTKVFLGAHALLANGNVMSRVGASQVALVAKAHNVPVLVCCETHKFCERVQTDSFVFNELGDPDDLVSVRPSSESNLKNWRDLSKLSLLNLMYDVTPGDLVTAVITELAVLPCTSVPVVLRVKHAV